jgi:RNA polymerase sigma-70 factor (ECF subfamily)
MRRLDGTACGAYSGCLIECEDCNKGESRKRKLPKSRWTRDTHFSPPPVTLDRLLPGNEALQVSCKDFLAYLQVVDAAPIQPVEQPLAMKAGAVATSLHPTLLDELWTESGAGEWNLDRDEFDRIILLAAIGQNFGVMPGTAASESQQAAFFKSIKLADLVLAKACAAGNERAWERFIAHFGQQLTRAAIAISGSESVGRDLADAFYAELYGLTTRDGVRRCPLDSYRGRGSLLGWLRTTLAQRFVDHYRRTYREQALDDQTHDHPAPDLVSDTQPALLDSLQQAVHEALGGQGAEDRFLLATYYLDDKTLAEIAAVLHVHEATISRRIRRATESVRKQLLRSLEKTGMSRRAAEEALGTDPRDIDLKMDFKKLLQSSPMEPFSEQAIASSAAAEELIARESLPEKAKTSG